MTEVIATEIPPFASLAALTPPAAVAAERRRSNRLAAPPLEILNLPASVVNIGLGGICLRLPVPAKFVEEQKLALRDRLTGEEQCLAVKVVWIGPDRAGLLWHSLDPACSRWLQDALARWAGASTG
jgi:hypothetical protein